MKDKSNRLKLIGGLVVAVLLVVYLGMIAYLNLAKYSQHVDSDIAAEALLTREIWEQKTLTPDDWISSTERRILAMPALAAPVYGMTGSMTVAVGIACVLLAGLFFWSFYMFLRKSGASKQASLMGLLMICALPINGIRNEGQMMPYVSLFMYLFAEYYVFHIVLLFWSILFYLHLKDIGTKGGSMTPKTVALWFILFGFTTVLSLGGQRCFQMIIIPLLVYECIALFVESQGFTAALQKGRLLATGYVGTSLLAGGISLLYDRQANYVMYLNSPIEVMNKAFIEVPAVILDIFGIAGNAKVGSFGSIMQLLVWAFLILVGYCLYYVMKRQQEVKKEQAESLLLLVASVGVTLFILCITTAEAVSSYCLVVWFVAILAIAIVYDCLVSKKSWFGYMILAAVCLFAVLNLKYTWWPAVTTEDNLQEYEEVVQYLIDQDISYGYAEFWDASRISLVKDGAITMGHSYEMDKLGMYWWLTSTKWYPPNLPTDMRTAYVVPQWKKEAFEGQFAEPDEMVLSFENERFAVYLSDTNYVNMP